MHTVIDLYRIFGNSGTRRNSSTGFRGLELIVVLFHYFRKYGNSARFELVADRRLTTAEVIWSCKQLRRCITSNMNSKQLLIVLLNLLSVINIKWSLNQTGYT
jgi:hypothetical protein